MVSLVDQAPPQIVTEILEAVAGTDREVRDTLDTIFRKRNEIPREKPYIVLYQRGHNFLLLKRDGLYVQNYQQKNTEQMRRYDRSRISAKFYYGPIFSRSEVLDLFSNIDPQRLLRHFEDQVH